MLILGTGGEEIGGGGILDFLCSSTDDKAEDFDRPSDAALAACFCSIYILMKSEFCAI